MRLSSFICLLSTIYTLFFFFAIHYNIFFFSYKVVIELTKRDKDNAQWSLCCSLFDRKRTHSHMHTHASVQSQPYVYGRDLWGTENISHRHSWTQKSEYSVSHGNKDMTQWNENENDNNGIHTAWMCEWNSRRSSLWQIHIIHAIWPLVLLFFVPFCRKSVRILL